MYSNEEIDNRRIFSDIADMMNEKTSSYKVPPVNTMDMDLLLAQIEIKAMRARQRIHTADMIDELRDVVVYTLNALRRLDNHQ